MPLFDEEQVWREIVGRAELGQDEMYLRLVKPEFKRQALFLRTQNGLVLPDYVVTKLDMAASSMEYHLSVTGKWATMADMQLAVGDIHWLGKKWVPMGMITVLAGEPGTSKSSFALWLCKMVTEGSTIDSEPFDPGPCIFVDAEAAQVITKQRCLNMGIDMGKIYVPNLGNDMLAQPDLNNEEHKQQLVEMVDDINPKLIVIDSLGGVKSGRENNKEDMQPTMLYLTHLVQNRECAIIVVHHLNKTKREEDEEITMNHLRGSSVIAQFTREILFLSRKPQGMQLRCGKSNLDKRPDPLLVRFLEERVRGIEDYDTIIRGFELEEWHEDIKVTKFMECENWITLVLHQSSDKALAAKEVFELGKDEPFTLPMIKAAAASLEKKGIITRSGGKYSVYRLIQPVLVEVPEGEE